MKCIFTIVAKNYLGLAQLLEASVRQHAPHISFYIFVADEPGTGHQNEPLPVNAYVSKDHLEIEEERWQEMAFKYNLVEFCTAIKPACFQFLFGKKDAEKVIYLDPDTFLFNSPEEIFQQLDTAPIVVTPHILQPQTPFEGNYADYLFLLNGTFNLGFLALKKSSTSENFLNWWNDRLKNDCFFDNDRGTATDQKWINLLPALFPAESYIISRHAGLNVAPWNFHEREVVSQAGTFFVKQRNSEMGKCVPLVFVHFSGYDYSRIGEGQGVHKTGGINLFKDMEPVFTQYAQALLKSRFTQYISLGYSYASYDNGVVVLSLHRRIFRRLLSEGQQFSNPFHSSKNSFYKLLASKNLIDRSTVSADKLTNKSVKNFSSKLGYVHLFFRFVKNIAGVRRYSVLIRFMRRFFSEENQAFLTGQNTNNKLW